MSHNARQSNDSQFAREASGTASKAPSDPFISNVLAHLGLGKRYLPEDVSLPSLLSELRNPNWQVRAAVVRRLGKLGAKAALEPLVAVLMQDSMTAVKVSAARALGELAYEASAEPLLAALNDPTDDVKAAVAWALGELGSHILTATPLENLLNCNSAAVRVAAIRALGELGARTPWNILAAAREDADWQVREIAALALERRPERMTRDALQPQSEGQDG